MRVRLLVEAEAEAREASRWYDQQRSGLGQDFLDALAHTLEAIERSPRAFAPVQSADPNREVRRCRLRRFPHVLYYEVPIIGNIDRNRRRPSPATCLTLTHP
jgi:ParE toxin of type II toxin-antitoxin system, parDE